MNTEQAEVLLAQAEADPDWVPTKANRQKWFCKAPCECQYYFGGRYHAPHEMPQFMQEILEYAISTTTTNPPTNHIMKRQPPDCQEANLNTAHHTPGLNSANLNLYGPESYTPQHSDDEPLFRSNSHSGDLSIVSVNVGAPKVFALKDKSTLEEKHFVLSNGTSSTWKVQPNNSPLTKFSACPHIPQKSQTISMGSPLWMNSGNMKAKG